MKSPIILLRDIHKEYRVDSIGVSALRGIDLSVGHGEFIAILGPSGSGKSTLMNILGCLDKPDSGEYLLNDKDIIRMTDNTLTRTRNNMLGFVFQNFNLLPKYTALENVECPLIYAGIPKKQRQKKAKMMLELVGLGGRINHISSQLSGGQQQRVAIARALVNDPKIVLADEPTGNLDTDMSDNIIALLENLNETRSLTILLITHEAAIAQRAHRRLYLKDGQLTEIS